MPSLRLLLDSPRHDVVAVLTRPDARSGRGRTVTRSPVGPVADAAGVPVFTPRRPSEPDFVQTLAGLGVDCAPVVAYGALLPASVLLVPRLGWINLHFSLLPAWRGAAPVQHAMLNGDEITGASTFLIEEGLDSGPVFGVTTGADRCRTTPAGDLLARLSVSGAGLLAATLDALADGDVAPREQPTDGISLAPKLTVEDARIDFARPAVAVDRRIRACTPAPGAWTTWRGERLKLGPARIAARAGGGAGARDASGSTAARCWSARPPARSRSAQSSPRAEARWPATDWARGARPAMTNSSGSAGRARQGPSRPGADRNAAARPAANPPVRPLTGPEPPRHRTRPGGSRSTCSRRWPARRLRQPGAARAAARTRPGRPRRRPGHRARLRHRAQPGHARRDHRRVLGPAAGRRWTPGVLDVLRLGAYQLLRTRIPPHAAVSATVDLARATGSGAGRRPGQRGPAPGVRAGLGRLGRPDRRPDHRARPAGRRSTPTRSGSSTPSPTPCALAAPTPSSSRRWPPPTTPRPDTHLVARPGRIDRDEPGGRGRRRPQAGPLLAVRGADDRRRPRGAGRGARRARRRAGRGQPARARSRGRRSRSTAATSSGSICAPARAARRRCWPRSPPRRGARLTANELREHRAELVRAGHRVLGRPGAGRRRRRPPAATRTATTGSCSTRPCTGLGALRRRPEARWRRQPGDVARAGRPAGAPARRGRAGWCARRRRRLRHVLAAPGRDRGRGRRRHRPARPGADGRPAVLPGRAAISAPDPTVQLWPHRHGTDAMFCALLRRPPGLNRCSRGSPGGPVCARFAP